MSHFNSGVRNTFNGFAPYQQASGLLLKLASALFVSAIHNGEAVESSAEYQAAQSLRRIANLFTLDHSTVMRGEDAAALAVALEVAHDLNHDLDLAAALPGYVRPRVETCPCETASIILDLARLMHDPATDEHVPGVGYAA